ncbi:MAG: hypothetical protein IJU45_09595, partial [Clostridia bacterium]|nr:hypothetical protein [Clostridia bacterium]
KAYAIGYQYSNKYEPVANFKIYCTAGSRAYQYATSVSVFQCEIITDSVDDISIDDTQPEENPSSVSTIENIINYITNFDIQGFVIYVFGLITDFIRRYVVLY